MDNHREPGQHLHRALPSGWWTLVLAGLALIGVAIVVLGIVLTVRLLLYLLGGIGPLRQRPSWPRPGRSSEGPLGFSRTSSPHLAGCDLDARRGGKEAAYGFS